MVGFQHDDGNKGPERIGSEIKDDAFCRRGQAAKAPSFTKLRCNPNQSSRLAGAFRSITLRVSSITSSSVSIRISTRSVPNTAGDCISNTGIV